MKKVVIVGGGLAGLLSAIQLNRAGIPCRVIEKKAYPFHRVCGEYISNETRPFLKRLGLFPESFQPPEITRFMLSSVRGKSATLPLDMGGFGISRFVFDHYLYQVAKSEGVDFFENEEVNSITFLDGKFQLVTSQQSMEADLVIGAFGKRSKVDHTLKRAFIKKRSPYMGVKYHLKINHPNDLIALHNFRGGYCGMSNIEEGKTTLCYLVHRDTLRTYKNIQQMEHHVLCENPFLRKIFTEADFLFEKPETINEISFETKHPVEDHIFMTGDAAGMIAPLCGNGMAMAICSAKILCELIIPFCKTEGQSRDIVEAAYTSRWNEAFKQRLWQGRQIQRLFGNQLASQLAVNLALYSKPITNAIMRNTHGEPF